MNFNQIENVLFQSFTATAQSQGKDSIVPFIWGPPGVGKSACALEAAHRLATHLNLKGVLQLGELPPEGENPADYFGFFDLRLSQMDGVEMGGFPHPDAVRQVMTRLIGSWFPHTGRTDLPRYGMLFLDEWTSAPQMVQAGSYQLANDRRLGEQTLKPEWMVFGAGNRVGDGGVVFKQPLPLSNRLAHFEFESDADTFMNWATVNGTLPAWVTSYLHWRPDNLNTFEQHVKDKLPGHAFATERTWHRFATISEHCDDSEQLRHWAKAYLGDGIATELIGFRRTWQELVSVQEVVDDPCHAPVPQRADVRYAMCGAMAAKATVDNVGRMLAYLERWDMRPMATLFMKDALRRNNQLHTAPEFARWAAEFCNSL